MDLVFNYIWSEAGGVRVDVDDGLVLITIRLLGVERVGFTGGLTAAMHADPSRIDWGLTEIALVQPFDSPVGYGLSVLWEGVRRLDVEFSRFEVLTDVKGQ